MQRHGTNPALAQTPGLQHGVSLGRRHSLVPVLHPKAHRQGAHGNIPTALIDACNPKIMFYYLYVPLAQFPASGQTRAQQALGSS